MRTARVLVITFIVLTPRAHDANNDQLLSCSIAARQARAALQLGKAYQKHGDHAKALKYYRYASTIDAQSIDAWLTRAQLYDLENDTVEAYRCYEQVVALDPTSLPALLRLGTLLCTQHKYDQALSYYLNALEHHTSEPHAAYGVAHCLYALGYRDKALTLYNLALKQLPDHALAHYELGMTYLYHGNYNQGWLEYLWRPRALCLHQIMGKQPVWDGSPVDDKTVLLYDDGSVPCDVIHFIAFAQSLYKQGAQVICQVPARFQPLLATCPYLHQVLTFDDALPEFNVHAPLVALPYYAHIFPALRWSYEPYLMTRIQDRIKNHTADSFVVGIAIGNLSPAIAQHLYKDLGELATIRIRVLDDTSVDDLLENAHIISQCDLVVASDCLQAHIAGALGVPTWLLLSQPNDWRWGTQDNCAWYPYTCLIRYDTDAQAQEQITYLVEQVKTLALTHQSLPESPAAIIEQMACLRAQAYYAPGNHILNYAINRLSSTFNQCIASDPALCVYADQLEAIERQRIRLEHENTLYKSDQPVITNNTHEHVVAYANAVKHAIKDRILKKETNEYKDQP